MQCFSAGNSCLPVLADLPGRQATHPPDRNTKLVAHQQPDGLSRAATHTFYQQECHQHGFMHSLLQSDNGSETSRAFITSRSVRECEFGQHHWDCFHRAYLTHLG